MVAEALMSSSRLSLRGPNNLHQDESAVCRLRDETRGAKDEPIYILIQLDRLFSLKIVKFASIKHKMLQHYYE